MKHTVQNAFECVESGSYLLKLAVPPQPSYLLCKDSGRLFAWIAAGDCSCEDKRDVTTRYGSWRVTAQNDEEILFEREDVSTVWKEKRFVLTAREDSLEIRHQLTGEGVLEDVRFFRSTFDGAEYGFAGNFDEVWSAAPNFREQDWYHPTARVIIAYGDDLSMCSGGHALASVPHVMALHDRRDQALLGAAVFACPGEYLWDEMIWNPEVRTPLTDFAGDNSMAGGFAITYYGKKRVKGKWCSPSLVFTFPKALDAVVPTALEYAYKNGFLSRPERRSVPQWWNEPIYCTWHDQCAMVRKDTVNYHDHYPSPGTAATEELTERWLNLLIEHNAKPGIVILDDKWQKSKLDGEPDTDKWPDMRRWIDQCHERGIRVFLWDAAWHNEDIPEDEAITRDGKIVCGDVTNPRYEARLRRKIRLSFSDEPGCLNADGVKIDGLLGLPGGRGLVNHGNLWGLELQRRFLEIYYDEAKRIKPEVCISTFSCHPYLDAQTDMVRLADMYVYRLTTADSMRRRAKIYRDCHPYTPIDTDGQMHFHYADDYLDDLPIQRELGIPSLYAAEFARRERFYLAPITGKITENDYRAFAESFAEFRNINE